MFRAFFLSQRWFWWAYGFGAFVLASLYMQVHMSVLLNVWYGQFYDMVQNVDKHNVVEYWDSLLEFGKLAGWSTLFATLTYGSTRFYGFAWREAIFMEYLPYWGRTGRMLEGECQRIQEDPMQFASIIDTLGIQVAKAFMVLFSFIPILWGLSKGVHITALDGIPDAAAYACIAFGLIFALFAKFLTKHLIRTNGNALLALPLWVGFIGVLLLLFKHGLSAGALAIPPLRDAPGALVWVALLVTLGGLIISWYVGHKLPGLEYNNQVVEARLRTALEVSVREKKKVTMLPHFIELFTGMGGVKRNYWRLFLHYGYFDLWSNSFSQALVILPYLIVGEGLFTKAITLGILIQVGNAFDKVQTSFGVFIDNWVTINKLRSIHKRLREFEGNLEGYREQ